MTSPAAAAFRSELNAALAKLEPQIRGFRALINDDDLSQESRNFIQVELNDHVRRRDLIKSNLTTLDALEGDDYPNMPVAVVPQAVFVDLAAHNSDIDAALAEFAPEAPASQLVFDAPVIVDK